MTKLHSSDLKRIYERHPLRLATLAARLLRDRGSLENVTELDLAMDRKTEITDQNHVGGVSAVERLARLACVTSTSRVLDLACGLGGPARLLAHRFGCRVDGIDISTVRVHDARALTRLASMSHLVSVRRGDIMRVRVPRGRYDVLWGQSSWVHVADKETLIARWSVALKSGGRLALQDSCVRRAVKNRREAALLHRLERDWASSLIPAPEWAAFAERAGLKVSTLSQSSRRLERHFNRLERAGARAAFAIPAQEIRSWQAAIEAAQTGLIAYFTLVAHT